MKHRLIITADDYGMCKVVNDAIEACMSHGVVTATCVMTNMPAFGTAVRLRQKFPDSSLGIHWTVTQGCPVLPPQMVPTLIGRNGEFHVPALFKRLWLLGRISKTELEAELTAQYERCCEAIGHPDFWNTHQNFHVFPTLYDTCVEIGLNLGIAATRSHRRITLPLHESPAQYHLRNPLHWLKGFGIGWWVGKAESRGAMMPDGILYVPDTDSKLTSLEATVQRVPWLKYPKALELVIHPATEVDARVFRRHAERRVQQYQLYANPDVRKRLRQLGVQLVGFEALHGSQYAPALANGN